MYYQKTINFKKKFNLKFINLFKNLKFFKIRKTRLRETMEGIPKQHQWELKI